jgi:Low specificity phosphatase (HAD superfamily)
MFNSFISKEEIQIRLSKIRCILLDWDGVFNNGYKHTEGSGFSETDSMGLNLFRYFLFRKNHANPFCAIISGEKNDTAFYYANREHLHACYFKIKDKSIALNDFKKRWNLNNDEIVYFFDDVLDLPVARCVGLRAYIHHPSRAHFLDFLKNENLCDVYSDLGGDNAALREIFENLMVLGNDFSSIMLSREIYDGRYAEYIKQRNSVHTEFYYLHNSEIIIQS